MWTSLLVSQATTHILIENDQITAFPWTNKCHLSLHSSRTAELKSRAGAALAITPQNKTPRAGLCFLPSQLFGGGLSGDGRGVILASGSWLPLSLLWFRRSPDTLTFLLLGSYRSPPGHWVGCSSLLTWHFKVWDELVHLRAGWTKGLVVPYSEAAEMQNIYRAANEVFSEPTVPPGPHYKLLFSITTCVLFPMQLIDVKLQQHWYK